MNKLVYFYCCIAGIGFVSFLQAGLISITDEWMKLTIDAQIIVDNNIALEQFESFNSSTIVNKRISQFGTLPINTYDDLIENAFFECSASAYDNQFYDYKFEVNSSTKDCEIFDNIDVQYNLYSSVEISQTFSVEGSDVSLDFISETWGTYCETELKVYDNTLMTDIYNQSIHRGENQLLLTDDHNYTMTFHFAAIVDNKSIGLPYGNVVMNFENASILHVPECGTQQMLFIGVLLEVVSKPTV